MDESDPIHRLTRPLDPSAVLEDVLPALVGRWVGPLAPTDGLVVTGRPAPLTRLYARIGHRDDLLREPDRIYRPDELSVRDGMLVFQEENQRVAFWACPAETTGDVPVYWSGRPGGPWAPYAPSLTYHLLESVLVAVMMRETALTFLAEVEGEPYEKQLDALTPLAVPHHPLWAAPDAGAPVRWFGDTDILVRDEVGHMVMASCRDEAAVERLRDRVALDWEAMDV